jgi:hypothetical protein
MSWMILNKCTSDLLDCDLQGVWSDRSCSFLPYHLQVRHSLLQGATGNLFVRRVLSSLPPSGLGHSLTCLSSDSIPLKLVCQVRLSLPSTLFLFSLAEASFLNVPVKSTVSSLTNLQEPRPFR